MVHTKPIRVHQQWSCSPDQHSNQLLGVRCSMMWYLVVLATPYLLDIGMNSERSQSSDELEPRLDNPAHNIILGQRANDE